MTTKWCSTIANVAEEAVAEELLPYKELFTIVVLQPDRGAVPILLQMNLLQIPLILLPRIPYHLQ